MARRPPKMLTLMLLLLAVLAGGAIINIAIAWLYVACIWDGGQVTGLMQSRVGPYEILNVTRDETAVTTFVSIERFAAQSPMRPMNTSRRMHGCTRLRG